MNAFQRIKEGKEKWERERISTSTVRDASTSWGMKLDVIYTPADFQSSDFLADIGFSGEYPFLRGPHASMYRGKLWTVRQYGGFGTPVETNTRFKYLLEQGNTGLSVAFDLPTQIGYDSDDPLVEDEVGRVGVAVDTLKDMEIIFDGIPLDKVTTSFTVNPTASIILGMYVALARKHKVNLNEIGGTLQNDILKEYMARGTQIFPPKPSLRLIGDVIEYCKDNVPRMNTISVCGYHMREAGCSLIQEVAYCLLNATIYIEEALKRGLKIDEFAPRISFLLGCGMNLFEEVAKFRAARRLWARIVKDRFKAENPASMKMRLFSGTIATAFTAKEPLNNIARGTIETLVAVLAGCQAIHTTSYDEAYEIPSEEAVRISLRTQQIIAYETDAASVADPVGGSYFVEFLTNKVEEQVLKEMQRIEKEGGILKGIEDGSIQLDIAKHAYESEKAIQSGKKVIVGVNKFLSDQENHEISLQQIRGDARKNQIRRLQQTKADRDERKVNAALNEIREAAHGDRNLMPSIISAVEKYATIGEICNLLREVFGEYQEARY